MKDIEQVIDSNIYKEPLESSTPEIINNRIRIARNIKGFPFPQWADTETLNKIGSLVKNAIGKSKHLKEFQFHDIGDLSPLKKQYLAEEHTISPHFSQEQAGHFLAYSGNKSIMINEEDHIRIQVLGDSLALEKSWEEAVLIDEELEKEIDMAFSEDWGYLTACPTNVGTAIRVSLMLHLPALVMTKQLHNFFQAVMQLGIVVRGLFGEGTSAIGNLFQVSNGTTLGSNEDEIIKHVKLIGLQIANKERTARKIILGRDKEKLHDRAARALGILRHAKLLEFGESMELLSMLRLGIDMELIKNIDISKINDLMIKIRPAHLAMDSNELFDAKTEQIKRAQLAQRVLL